MKNQFIIRVYGLWVQNNKVLVSDEIFKGKAIKKFPGGGLQFGEGTIFTLHREFMEELNREIQNPKLFYVTENFIESTFDPNQQFIGIYYLVDCDNPKIIDSEHVVHWIDLSTDAQKVGFTFPHDTTVFSLLQKQFVQS